MSITRLQRNRTAILGLVVALVSGHVAGVPHARGRSGLASAAQADRSVPVRDWRAAQPAGSRIEAYTPSPPAWPRADSKVIDLATPAATAVEVGGLPVTVGPAGPSVEAPGRVRVEVLDPGTRGRFWATVLMRISRADGHLANARVTLTVDYARFRSGYGADWAARLRLASMPECLLSSGAERRCSEPTWLPSTTDPAAQTISAPVDLAENAVVALLADATGESGDFTQSDFKASYSWTQGGPSGDFVWSYPLQPPDVPGGLVPSVALAYSSGAVDGQTAGQNAQPSWVGEGWGYSPPYIERTYRLCADDRDNSPHWTQLNAMQFLCWRADNAHVVFDGKATEIILGDDGVWRLADDDGEKVERLRGANNGDNTGEHWKITTTDGTQYWFGRHYLPSGRGSTNSTGTVKVFANHPGEPGFSSESLNDSARPQAYRWMLDYVVDVHGNEMSYWYTRSTNRRSYVVSGHGGGVYSYVREVRPHHIEYGTRVGDDAAAQAPARVVFAAASRCLQDCFEDDGDPRPGNWPDTPWDLQCTDTMAEDCGNNAPQAFFSSTRLAQISTQVLDGGAYRTVDRWDLTHQFPATGNGTSPALWLASITRTAYGADGSTVVMPAVTFDGARMPNRAFYDPAAANAPHKYRVTAINTETGGQIRVSYSVPGSDCLAADTPPAPHSNGRRCFPRGTGRGQTWWHKYSLYQVVERDLVGGSPDVVHTFSMGNTGASTSVKWAFDNGPSVWGASVDRRTWSDWRGWPRVTVITGTSAGTRSQTDYLYFRGLSGDRADPSGATRTATVTDDVVGSTFSDNSWRAGQLLQARTFDVAGGTPVELTRWVPTQTNTGTRTVPANLFTPNTFKSYLTAVNQERSWNRDPATASWQIRGHVDYTLDGLGRTVTAHDHRRDTCARTHYADNTAKHLLESVSREQINAGPCDAPRGLLSDARYFYDGQATHGTAPTLGNLTSTEVYGNGGWFVDTQSTYDAYGRQTSSRDGLGRTTTTAYTHGGDRRLTTVTATNPAGHVTATTIEAWRGLPVAVADANGKTTTARYDAAGRLLKVWGPGRDPAGTPDAEYTYSISRTAPSFVSTKVLGPNGNQILSYEIYDGLLRPRQAQDTAPDGKRVISDTRYDQRDLVVKESTFYNAASGPSATLVAFNDADVDRQVRYGHDGQEREVTAQLWYRNQLQYTSGTAYGFRTVTVTPPPGGTVTREVYDERDNLVALRHYRSGDTGGPYDQTSYGYDPLDRLVTISDPAGTTWTHAYDVAGRLASTADPDAGTTTMTYDAAGQMTRTTDARGVNLAYGYDALGRRTAIHEGSLTGAKRAEWRYDTLAKGLLTAATRYQDGLAYTTAVTAYDSGYRPLGTSITIPASAANGTLAGTYTTRMTYRADGSLATETPPAAAGLPAETITHTYTDQGLPATSTGLDAYLAAAAYRWDGAVAETRHGPSGRQVRQSFAYHEATGRTTTAQTDISTQPGVFVNRYTTEYNYDPAGNVTAIAGKTNGIRDQVECFRHDHLRRLTEAWTAATSDCTAGPRRTGADPYHRSWTFDTAGNRLSQTDHDPAAGNTIWTYQIGTAHGVRPHQVAAVTAAGPRAGTGAQTFAYDPAGNTTRSTTETGAAQTHIWDTEGRLTSVAAGQSTVSYVYDADGSLLITREPGTTTLHLDSTEVRSSTGGAVAGIRYYDDVAVRTPAGLFWTAADRAGTPVVQTDAQTLESDRRRILPYGEPRGDQPHWEGSLGYAGGTVDSTGLTHLGARSYQPSLGRFTSTDPIMNLTDAAGWDGYAYAGNSPITWADPTGLARICVDTCGGAADRSIQNASKNGKGKAGPSKGKAGPSKGKAGPSKGKAGPSKGKAGPGKKGKPGPSKGKAGPSKKGKSGPARKGKIGKGSPSKGKKPSGKDGDPSISKGKKHSGGDGIPALSGVAAAVAGSGWCDGIPLIDCDLEDYVEDAWEEAEEIVKRHLFIESLLTYVIIDAYCRYLDPILTHDFFSIAVIAIGAASRNPGVLTLELGIWFMHLVCAGVVGRPIEPPRLG